MAFREAEKRAASCSLTVVAVLGTLLARLAIVGTAVLASLLLLLAGRVVLIDDEACLSGSERRRGRAGQVSEGCFGVWSECERCSEHASCIPQTSSVARRSTRSECSTSRCTAALPSPLRPLPCCNELQSNVPFLTCLSSSLSSSPSSLESSSPPEPSLRSTPSPSDSAPPSPSPSPPAAEPADTEPMAASPSSDSSAKGLPEMRSARDMARGERRGRALCWQKGRECASAVRD